MKNLIESLNFFIKYINNIKCNKKELKNKNVFKIKKKKK